jgi:hypothetical protein
MASGYLRVPFVLALCVLMSDIVFAQTSPPPAPATTTAAAQP